MKQHLIVFSQWRVIICIQCQHEIKSKHVIDHFTKYQHKLLKNQIELIHQELAQTNVIQNSQRFESIFDLNEFIFELKMQNKIFVCVVDFVCIYTTTKIANMRSHCSIHHLDHKRRFSIEKIFSSWIFVSRCQQMFSFDHDSNYFRMNFISSTMNETNDDVISVNAIDEVEQLFRVARDALNFRILQRVKNRQKEIEFASWMKKMNWFKYLNEFNRQQLMNLMKFFIVDEKSLTIIVWKIVNKMLQQFRQTIKSAKYFLCMKIVRNEIQQIKYQSLQTYMNVHFFKNYARSWKQIVVFFVRIQFHQKNKNNEMSTYKFDEKEQNCFDDIIQQTQRFCNRDISNQKDIINNMQNLFNEKINQSNHHDFDNDKISWISLQDLELTCLRFYLALLDRQIHRDEYELLMLCVMIVLIIKSQKWRTSHEYSFIMSHIIKMIRFMIIQTIFQNCDVIHVFVTKEKSNMMKYAHRLIDQCMIRNNRDAIQWIFDRRAYDMKIHYINTSTNNVNWMKNRIRYKQMKLSINQLREMIHDLIDKTYRILKTMLHFSTTKFFVISWLSLRDDFIRKNVEHNFIHDARNHWSMNAFTWLLNHLIDKRIFAQRNQSFHEHKIKEWTRLIDQFHDLLITLMQWSWKQNARDIEFLIMCEWNFDYEKKHNMFIVVEYDFDESQKNQMKLVIRYHKNYNIFEFIKVIHRFLSREMSALLIWIVWLIRSTWNTLQQYRFENQHQRQWKIWHVDVNDQKWTLIRINRKMKQINQKACEKKLMIRFWRNISIVVSRKYLRKKEDRFQQSEKDYDHEKKNDEMKNLQTKHDSHVVDIVYARNIRERNEMMKNLRQKFRRTNESWQREMNFVIFVIFAIVSNKRKRVENELHVVIEIEFKRLTRSSSLNLNLKLRKLMRNDRVTFRNFQRIVIDVIMRAEKFVLIIMFIEIEKSLLFMLSTFCNAKEITIVNSTTCVCERKLIDTQMIVFLIALRQNLRQKCQNVDIRCREWNSHNSSNEIQLMLITFEFVLIDDFFCFFNRFENQKRLNRIVIDECHVVLNDQSRFRFCLQRLRKFCRIKTSTMMLIVILSLLNEIRFLKIMCMKSCEIELFKSFITRTNIRYRTWRARSLTS